MDMVSCAPVCCMEKGEFVDGCPAGDKCQFGSDGLKCCPPNEESCGPRPTACVNFGKPTAANMNQVVCERAYFDIFSKPYRRCKDHDPEDHLINYLHNYQSYLKHNFHIYPQVGHQSRHAGHRYDDTDAQHARKRERHDA
ncbi:hypothetical protein ABW21_db0201613 [Orbilia brochopaga]|nr:hypothetical protein ABW21_db0201613 [Drechslerella brochopaga]